MTRHAASRMPRSRLDARLGALLAIASVVALVLPPSAAAADVTFGDPTATWTYGTGVDFDQPVVGGGIAVRRIEILMSDAGSTGPSVTELPVTGPLGSMTLHHRLEDSAPHIYPNTTLTARWRIVDTAGGMHLGPPVTITYADTRFDWQTVSGPIVRVHWYVGDRAFGARALSIAEAGVAKAEALLGVTETEPVDFFVYATQDAFYDALGPGTRENVGGLAVTALRTLYALITPDQINDSWVGEVLPHELTHLVAATAVENPYHRPPRWLNEGLAVYLSQGYDDTDRLTVRRAARSGTLIPLPGIAGLFPTTFEKFGLAYAESVSAVDFLIRTYGQPALVKLITSYSQGVTDDEALQAAIGLDVAGFNAAWMADLQAVQPRLYGPQVPPIGPLPSGWSSSPAPEAATPRPNDSPPASSASPPSPPPSSPTAAPASPGTPPPRSPAASAPATPGPTLAALAAATATGSSGPSGRDVAGILGLVAIALAGLGAWLVFAARRPPITPR